MLPTAFLSRMKPILGDNYDAFVNALSREAVPFPIETTSTL